MTAQPLQRLFAERRQLLALEADRARGDAAGLGRDQAQDGKRRHRLAAARFAYDAQGLAARQLERHAVDRAHHAVQRVELGVEISDFQDRVHSRLANRGSRRSRSPSPKRFTASTVMARNVPGIRIVQGAIWKKVRPWAMMLPQLGTSGGTPAPRKLRPASISIAEAQT